jgi:hypothetical protein
MGYLTLNVPGHPLVVPSPTAFDYVFYLVIVTMVVVILLAAASKNYIFTRQAPPAGPRRATP